MANNTYTKNYTDGTALTEAKLDAAYQSLKLDITNTTLMTAGATAGHFLKCTAPGSAAAFAAVPDPLSIDSARNYGLTAAVSTAGAMVISLKTAAGTDATSSDVIAFGFSSSGASSALLTEVTVAAAKSITVNSSASLGIAGTIATRVYVYAYRNGTSANLAVSSRSDWNSGNPVTTVAITSTADSAFALYATAATSVIPNLIGWALATKNTSNAWQAVSRVAIATSAVNSDYQRPTNSGTGSTGLRGVALGTAISEFTTTSSTLVDVTNMAVTLTTAGRPVFVGMQSTSTSAPSSCILVESVGLASNFEGDIAILRDGAIVSYQKFKYILNGNSNDYDFQLPVTAFWFLDTPVAGSHVYKIQIKVNSSLTNMKIREARLIAYEI